MKSIIKTKHALCGLLSGLLLLAAGTHVQASLIFHSLTSTGSDNLSPQVSGTEFTVGAAPLTIQALGVFDLGLDGLVQARDVGLWNAGTQALVASTTVPAGAGGFLIENWRFANLGSAVTLDANTTYRIATYWANISDFSQIGGSVSAGPGISSITPGQVMQIGAGGLVFPGNSSSLVTFNANASTDVVPEPGTAVLLLGSGAMLLLRRRRAAV